MDEKTVARFWSKVEKTDGCWLWRASRSVMGYGYFRVKRRTELAHRVAFSVANGRAPVDCVLHRCDTPACVNPRHLFEGSRTDNHLDKMSKGRGAEPPHRSGVANHNAKLDDEKVRQIRAFLLRGESLRSLARRFLVSKKTILNIKTNRIWRHVTFP